MLVRFDPIRETQRFAGPRFAVPAPRTAPFALDVFRRGDQYVLQADLPGIDPDSIDVTVEEKTLSISADRPSSIGEGDTVLISERTAGKAMRKIRLGEGLVTDQIGATYDRGVLTVSVPVAAKPTVQRITVAEGASTVHVTQAGESAVEGQTDSTQADSTHVPTDR